MTSLTPSWPQSWSSGARWAPAPSGTCTRARFMCVWGGGASCEPLPSSARHAATPSLPANRFAAPLLFPCADCAVLRRQACGCAARPAAPPQRVQRVCRAPRAHHPPRLVQVRGCDGCAEGRACTQCMRTPMLHAVARGHACQCDLLARAHWLSFSSLACPSSRAHSCRTLPWLLPRRWAGRGAVGYQQLAEDGFAVLGERLRGEEERATVAAVLQKVLGAKVRQAAALRRQQHQEGADVLCMRLRPVAHCRPAIPFPTRT